MVFAEYASRLQILLSGLIVLGTLIDQVSALDLRAPFPKIKRAMHGKPDSSLHQRFQKIKRKADDQSSITFPTTAENSENFTSGAVNTPHQEYAKAPSFRSAQPSDSSSSSSALASIFASSAMKQNGLYLGFLPDDGSSGGSRQTMAQLNADIGGKSAGYGWYAQATAGTLFDGSQLLEVLGDVKACNCVFQPAVMPIGGWQGLTESDNSQAVAIANVMKKFTDEGIAVWLRFAHEANFYQTDGTYQGTAEDFKQGWATVSAAVKSIAPQVKMWWTPNVASAENYAEYEPSDLSTVDLVGVDYYPKQLTGSDFISTMKAFHDHYAVDGRVFAIGETGLGWNGSIDDRFKWLAEIAASKSSMPQFLTMSWFNYHKEYDFKVAGEDSLNQKFTSFVGSQSP